MNSNIFLFNISVHSLDSSQQCDLEKNSSLRKGYTAENASLISANFFCGSMVMIILDFFNNKQSQYFYINERPFSCKEIRMIPKATRK